MSRQGGTTSKTDLSRGAKRMDAYTYDPNEVVLITDPKDPLYDPRVVTKPITREKILNIATFGILQNLIFRRRNDEIVVQVGKQRTKHVCVINALLGYPYKGDLAMVREAITEFMKDTDLVKQIVALTKGVPLRLPGLLRNSGDVTTARLIVTSENTQRVDDAQDEAIKRVQENHEKFHISVEDLAIAEGRSIATIKRWLSVDTSKPKTKKTRGKATHPSKKTIKGFIEKHGERATKREKLLFAWWQGEVDMTAVVEAFTK